MMTGDGGPLIFLHAMDLPSILFRSRHECRGGEANILCPVQLFILPFCHQLEHVAAIEVGNSSTGGFTKLASYCGYKCLSGVK